MPTFVTSYNADSGASSNTNTLTTTTFTPSNGDILIVKMATWDTGSTMNAPTGGSQTYTSRVVYSPPSNRCWVAIYTAVISGSPVNMSVSSTHSATASMHSLCVERWSSASLAGTPVTQTANGDGGTPSASLTTSAANSVISVVNADWNGNSPTGTTYLGSSTQTFVYTAPSEGLTTQWYWRQAVASAGATTFGLSAPSGQTWTLAGIELLHAGGQSVTLGTVTDTSSALTASRTKRRTFLVVTDTASAQVLARIKRRTLSVASETSTVVGPHKARTLGVGGETDTALAVGRSKRRSLGAVSEAESLPTLGRTKSTGLGSASESDGLGTLSRTKTRGLSTVGESGSASGVSEAKTRVLGAGVDSTTVLSLARAKVRGIQVVSEVESAHGIVARAKVRNLGLASETDNALLLGSGLAVVLGLVSETNSALALSRVKRGALNLASETSAGIGVARTKLRGLGTVGESGSGFGISRTKQRGIANVSESDNPYTLANGQRLVLGVVQEISAALSLVLESAVVVEQGLTDSWALRKNRANDFRRA